MLQLFAFRRSLRLVALAVCAMALAVVSISPASARSHHGGTARHAHAYRFRHYAQHHTRHSYRHVARSSRSERGVAQMQARGFADSNASINANAVPNTGGVTAASSFGTSSFGSSGLVSEARRYLGGNPTSRGSLWCARFMNMVLQHTGYKGTGSDMAASFAHYGQRVSGPEVGAIAVIGRRGGGHVGIITGIDASGNPIMISGNNGNRVREAPISRGRIYAYVMPAG
jgi:uncharacterized protein (TIGR02594 family)